MGSLAGVAPADRRLGLRRRRPPRSRFSATPALGQPPQSTALRGNALGRIEALCARSWRTCADTSASCRASQAARSPRRASSGIRRKVLFGRDNWLDALDAAWANPKLNVYTLVAWGGVGKTSLVAHWVSQRMAAKGWPGVERYFDWSFYSQGTGESRQTSSDLFIQEALKFFDDPDPTKGSPWERGERLAGLVREHRTLLCSTASSRLQYPLNDPQAGRLKDQALEALLQGLAADNPGLCIVTTREHLKNIENQATTEEQKLDKLVKEAAIDLLRHLQIVGTEAEMEAAWKDAGGHALTLQLLGRFLADAHGGDIRHYKEVKFEEADLERQGRSAFKVMIAYERWLQSAGPERQRELALLRLTGLFDRPMSRDCLQALRAEPAIPGLTDTLVKLKDPQWNIALKRLERSRSPDRDAGRHRRPSADPRVLRQAASRHAARRVPGRPLAAVRSPVRDHAAPARYARWPAAALPGRRPRLPRRATAGGVRQGLRRPHPARHGERWLLQHEGNSGRSGPISRRWRRSSTSRGAASPRISAKPTRPGC